jgi:hypothetical protein
MERKFMHTVTGSVDTREGWVLSYTEEELDDREISAEQAFEIDLNDSLLEEI